MLMHSYIHTEAEHIYNLMAAATKIKENKN